MFQKTVPAMSFPSALACLLLMLASMACSTASVDDSSAFVQFGAIHEAIGQGQDQARVELARIVSRKHFYGIGALEGLRGEITLLDSQAVITEVTEDGRPEATASPAAGATMLAGRSVDSWVDIGLTGEVSPELFDDTVAASATTRGIDVSKPFVFVIKGTFKDVRLHVINGACPVRARMKNIELDADKRPFELNAKTMTGTIVGIYAADSVGKLTHPATSTHAHLIYEDAETGNRITGHLEQVGLAEGTILMLPDTAGPNR